MISAYQKNVQAGSRNFFAQFLWVDNIYKISAIQSFNMNSHTPIFIIVTNSPDGNVPVHKLVDNFMKKAMVRKKNHI